MQETIKKLINSSLSLGQIGFLIIENSQTAEKIVKNIKKILEKDGYSEKDNYIQIMEALSSPENRFYYIEKKDKLNSSVLEIIAEYEAGIISLADRINNSGLKTVKFNSKENSLIIIITREQIEKSYSRLFEYVYLSQSLWKI